MDWLLRIGDPKHHDNNHDQPHQNHYRQDLRHLQGGEYLTYEQIGKCLPKLSSTFGVRSRVKDVEREVVDPR